MTMKQIKAATLAIAACGMAFAVAPAQAVELSGPAPAAASTITYSSTVAPVADVWEHGRDRGKHRGWHKQRHRDNYYGRHDRVYYGDRVHRNTRAWRGRDGRYYCQKDNGTTGLLIGAAVGGLVGNEVAGRRDKTIGTLLGAVGGAFLGREIDKGEVRCR